MTSKKRSIVTAAGPGPVLSLSLSLSPTLFNCQCSFLIDFIRKARRRRSGGSCSIHTNTHMPSLSLHCLWPPVNSRLSTSHPHPPIRNPYPSLSRSHCVRFRPPTVLPALPLWFVCPARYCQTSGTRTNLLNRNKFQTPIKKIRFKTEHKYIHTYAKQHRAYRKLISSICFWTGRNLNWEWHIAHHITR